MGTLESKTVLTIDVLGGKGGTLHPVQRAWIEGRRPPVRLLSVRADYVCRLRCSKTTPNPTDAQIDSAMAGNICRCGTYQRICAAIKTAAKERA